MTRLTAIAMAAAYFPYVHGPRRVERGPRSRYFREYSYRRYHHDPAYRERKRVASRRRRNATK